MHPPPHPLSLLGSQVLTGEGCITPRADAVYGFCFCVSVASVFSANAPSSSLACPSTLSYLAATWGGPRGHTASLRTLTPSWTSMLDPKLLVEVGISLLFSECVALLNKRLTPIQDSSGRNKSAEKQKAGLPRQSRAIQYASM